MVRPVGNDHVADQPVTELAPSFLPEHLAGVLLDPAPDFIEPVARLQESHSPGRATSPLHPPLLDGYAFTSCGYVVPPSTARSRPWRLALPTVDSVSVTSLLLRPTSRRAGGSHEAAGRRPSRPVPRAPHPGTHHP